MKDDNFLKGGLRKRPKHSKKKKSEFGEDYLEQVAEFEERKCTQFFV